MSAILTWLEANASQTLNFWLTMQLQMAGFVLLVWLLERALPEKWSTPRLRYLLWSTVLLKALIPPVISLPGGEALPMAAFNFAPVEVLAPGAIAAAPGGISFSLIVVAVIIACSLTLAGIALWRAVSLRRVLRAAEPFAAVPAGGWPPVFVSDRIPSPLATGIRHPRIYITPAIAEAPQDILHAVLQHERAHIRRRDAVAVVLQTVLQIVYVLNPMMWMANLRIFRYRELICDEEALSTGSTRPQEYGRLLIDFAQAQPARILQTGTCFFETRRGFVQRISELFNTGNRSTMQWKHYTIVAVFALAILPLSWRCSSPVDESEPLAQEVPRAEKEFEIQKTLQGQDASDKSKESQATKEPMMYQATMSFNKQRALDGARTGVGSSIDSRTEPVPESEFAAVSQPVMMGGIAELRKHIRYPEEALADSAQGTVIVEAEIVGDGPPAQLIVLRSVHPALDKAAKAAVGAMYFTAGRSKGKIVATTVAIPIKFRLK